MSSFAEQKWQPGQSGNPKGRPKGAKSTKTILAELLEIGDRRTKVLERLITLATDADKHSVQIQAIAEILDRLDGKPTQHVEQTNIQGPDLSNLTPEELYRLKYGESNPTGYDEPDEE